MVQALSSAHHPGQIHVARQQNAEAQQLVKARCAAHDGLLLEQQGGGAQVDGEVGSQRARPDGLPEPQHLQRDIAVSATQLQKSLSDKQEATYEARASFCKSSKLEGTGAAMAGWAVATADRV